jgi:hypothetical protein
VSEWWQGIASARATIDCGGQTHRLRWQSGVLLALDHDDAEGERALAALGGDRCACVDMLGAWERHREDPRVLVLASRGPADPLPAQPDRAWHGSPHGGFAIAVALPAVAPRGSAADPEDDLVALLTLGGGLPTRLVATVAAAWRERPLDARHEAALYGRALVAMRAWLEQPEARIDLEMSDDRPSVQFVDGTVRARLPFTWLIDVWAKGLATVAGRFCLDARSHDGRQWTLTTVGPDLGEPTAMGIDLGPGAATEH